MFETTHVSPDTAKLLLRVVLGGLILLHGIFKVMNPGAVDFIGGLFENFYLPAFLAYLVYLGEVIAPIMLIVGYKVRTAANLIAITMAVAIILAHSGDLFSLTQTGGSAIALQLMFLVGALVSAGIGAGKYTLLKK